MLKKKMKKSNSHEQQILPGFQHIDGIDQLLVVSYIFPSEIVHRTNCFLVGDKGANKLIIDPSPANDAEYERLVNTLKKSFDYDYTDIFITHHHVDHVNCIEKLAREFKIPIIISEDSYRRLMKKNGSDFFANIKIKFAREGDILSHWHGQEIKVYEIPGHDEGQLALAPESMTWFMVGDLIQGPCVGPEFSGNTVAIATDEGDMKKYFHTLERIIRFNPKYLLASHGLFPETITTLQKTLEHRKKREREILELYQKGKTPDEIVAKIYQKVNEELRYLAVENINAHLKKLKQEGII